MARQHHLTLRRDAPADETKGKSNGSSVLANVVNSYDHILTPLVVLLQLQPCRSSRATATCNGQSFNLVLSGSTTGVAPFDLTIAGPSGTATYNDIPVGGCYYQFCSAY